MKQQALTARSFMEQKVKQYFMNESADFNAFEKLDQTEVSAVTYEYGLSELANLNSLIGSLFKAKDGTEVTFKAKVFEYAYNKDITKAAGDITKTKHHANMMALLRFAVSTNELNGKKSPEAIEFNKRASVVLDAASFMERNADFFKKRISLEKAKGGDSFTANFFLAAVYLIQTTGDILYSNSMMAHFNYNATPPVADDIYFEYKSGIIDDNLSYIEYLNASFRNGVVVNTLTKLNESFTDTLAKGILNENILDTVFGIATQFKIIDATLLFPVYLVRFVTYWILYTVETVKNISIGIDDSIEMRKKRTITEDDFSAYKKSSTTRAHQLNQNTSKADVTLQMNARDDKKTLEKMQSNILI